MKKVTIYLVGIVAFLCAFGCKPPYEEKEVLISRDDISLTIKGEPVFVFDADKCQTAYNVERNEYRAMTDDISEYFILKADQRLSDLNQEFTADLTYTVNKKEKKASNLEFKIEKINNASGLVWLWCADKSIGLVVRVF